MNTSDYKALVDRLGRNEKAMLDELRRVGKASAPDLRHVTESPTTGQPLAYGLTRELQKLQALGLIRRVGRDHPKRYQVVPKAEVEETAKRYELRGKRARKRRRSTAARVAELRVYEHGDYSEFYRVHRRVLDLTDYVSRQITRMAFWEAAPKDDLAQTVEDLADLLDAVEQALACLKQRADDDALLSRIEKVQRTPGRTAGELENARTLARKLREQYEERVGP